MRINSVYKQASIERASIKKKASHMVTTRIDAPLLSGHNTELVLL